MSVDVNTLHEFNGKQVMLETEQLGKVEGTVEAASSMGVAFRLKGKRDVQLILPAAVKHIEALPDKPKPLVARTLQPITEASARRHLFHLHNFERSELIDVTDEEALEIHNEIDHSDLGHKHKDQNAEVDEDDDESEEDEDDAEDDEESDED